MPALVDVPIRWICAVLEIEKRLLSIGHYLSPGFPDLRKAGMQARGADIQGHLAIPHMLWAILVILDTPTTQSALPGQVPGSCAAFSELIPAAL
jgi:hypothetical protein